MVRLAAIAAISVVATAIGDAEPTRIRGTMIDTIKQICDYVMTREQTAASTAHRFGMHLHAHEGANITFTPRDRRFSRGSAEREWQSEVLAGVALTVDARSTLTIGEIRAAFGPLARSEGQHYDDPPRFVATFKRADRPLVCDVIVDLEVRFIESEPTDDLRVKKITLLPGPKAQ